ncbi:DNA helicase UvrD, partial [Candidatus Gottesmanbacteria bacterium]|nr:DNA helicase UvrD [Candidatus Gottesmanbacteria bacterium]
MKIAADLHLHSKYSRAVSQEMVLPQIGQWAVKKGIGLVGTGDWTHPLWLREIKANLEEVGPGLYGLKGKGSPLFILATEISSIYSQGGKLRRIHNIILAPSLEVAEKINKELASHGANLMSDGRPVTGIPAQNLVKMILAIDENCLIIPAHAWTPWFSLYGSESGFDSIGECFGEMAKYIYAIETGLSSNPEMNWRIAELDSRQIVSFSDAHSGPKLGREATVFTEGENGISNFSYEDIKNAIKGESGKLKIAYTLEFYPEEGKYHYTGHRDCKVRQSPEETGRLGETCPVCGKHLTVGVMHRVQ